MIYQNELFSLVRKPQKIPSTFGNQTCLLDLFCIPQELEQLWKNDKDKREIIPHISVSGYTQMQNTETWIHHQCKQFSKEEEYGLLNRLDNDTGGFVYFANTPESRDIYHKLQDDLAIKKYYIARVSGHCPSQEINFPIFHHRNPQKMTINPLKSRGDSHKLTTIVNQINYDSKTDTTLLKIQIQKGIRHQIRLHLASSGHPIIGDTLYE